MGPIYKYGLENNKQSKKSSFTYFLPGASNNSMTENIIDEAESEAEDVKSVREGKLERKESFKEAKKEVKNKRDDSLSKLDEKKKSYLKTSGNTEGAGYSDVSQRKQIRAEKRREMQDVRDKERGARNADRRNRGIERMANRNNMTTEDATKAYDTRMSTYQAYNVNRSNAEASKTFNKKETKNADNVYKGLLGVGDKTYANATFGNLGNFDELSSGEGE